MTRHSSRPSQSQRQAQAELELLQFVLQGTSADQLQDGAYPWNPAAAEQYFEALEQEVAQAGWSNEDLMEQGQILSNYLEQVWTEFEPAAPVLQTASVDLVSANLLKQFAAQVPQQLLSSIVQRAQQVALTQLSLADQMVQCVQDCLPNWASEDLYVLARPFANAMRGADTELVEAALRSVRCEAWTELSGVEQARLSLAIARYAIAQMPMHPDQNP